MLEVVPPDPTWFVATDASSTNLGRFFMAPAVSCIFGAYIGQGALVRLFTGYTTAPSPGKTRPLTLSGPFLRANALLLIQQCLTSYTRFILGVNNVMANSASQ